MHPGRRSIRVPGFDYAQSGAYFVTICTHDGNCLFGEVIDAEMRVVQGGRIADECWRNIPAHFPRAVVDEYVIMPNHIHGVILISPDDVGFNILNPYKWAELVKTNSSE